MHILIIGASGRTGRLAVSKALEQGHSVTALVRNPANAPFQTQPNLDIVQGDPRDLRSVEQAFSTSPAIDAVIITLAVPRTGDAPWGRPTAEPYLIRDSVQNALTAMKKYGTKKLVVMSAFGTGDSFANMAWPLRALMRNSNMVYVYEDHDATHELLEQTVEDHGIQWSSVRPGMLNDRETGKAVREFGASGKGVGMFDSTERLGVADFLVKEVEREDMRNEAVVIVN